MMPDTFTAENFATVGLALCKMAITFWPIIVMFVGFLVWENWAENKKAKTLKG